MCGIFIYDKYLIGWCLLIIYVLRLFLVQWQPYNWGPQTIEVCGIREITKLGPLSINSTFLLAKLDDCNCVDYFMIVNIWLAVGYLYFLFWDSSWNESWGKENNWARSFEHHRQSVIGEVGWCQLCGIFIDSQYLIGWWLLILCVLRLLLGWW